MIGFIILIIAAFYKAFTGDDFIKDISALGCASIGELMIEISFALIFSARRL